MAHNHKKKSLLEELYFESDSEKGPALSKISTEPDEPTCNQKQFLTYNLQKLQKWETPSQLFNQQSFLERKEECSGSEFQGEANQEYGQSFVDNSESFLPIQEHSWIDVDEIAQKPRRRNCKERKIRTTVTKQRLEKMNKIFVEYYNMRQNGKNPSLNLKDIACTLNLGYSTILHKFRQFRNNREVKGGALLQSLQKKRKYKKSYEIEKCIEQSLRERSFTTAVELSMYIKQRYRKQFSRSIISRHLATMGYSFNNVKYHTPVSNDQKHIETRQIYACFIRELAIDKNSFIYIDEFAFSKKLFVRHAGNFSWSVEDRLTQSEEDYVTLLVAANHQKMFYYDTVEGFYTRERFCSALKHLKRYVSYQAMYNINKFEPILLTDMNPVHIDSEVCNRPPNKTEVSSTLTELGFRRYFLPPASPQLNPLETFFDTLTQRVPKSSAIGQKQLKKKIETVMKQIFGQSTAVYFKNLDEWLSKAAKRQVFE